MSMVRTGEGDQDTDVRSMEEDQRAGMAENCPSSPYEQEDDGHQICEEDDGPVMAEVGDCSEDSDASDGRGSHSDDKRPHHTFMNLIAMAIMSSPKKMMVLPEIYEYIQKNFPFYSSENKRAWQNAVRHNLSLHDCFVKVPRYKVEAPTTSCYWRLSDDARDLYERGESLKRKGVYRRKCGPRGVVFRGAMAHSAHGGIATDPYAKQQLYSSTWRIRHPVSGGYALRLDDTAPVTNSGKASAAVEWSQKCVPYGFTRTRADQRQPCAVSPASSMSRYDRSLAMSAKHRENPQRDTASLSSSGFDNASAHPSYGRMDHQSSRPKRGGESRQDSSRTGARHHVQTGVRECQAKRAVPASGRLTFDTRQGLRRYAMDVQGRFYQVETFRSDRWRRNFRAIEIKLSQGQLSDMIRELCQEVQEAYETVAETMRVLAKTGHGSAQTAVPASTKAPSGDTGHHSHGEQAHSWEPLLPHMQQQHHVTAQKQPLSAYHVTSYENKHRYHGYTYDDVSQRHRLSNHSNQYRSPVNVY